MNLEALKYYVNVIEERSISKAASKMHLSQSALSQMIQKMEEDFGYVLLNRSNRGVEITPAGEIVLKYAQNIIKSVEKIQDELKTLENHNNRIIIGGTWSLAAYSLPCMLYRLKKQFHEHHFDLVAKSNKEILLDIKNDLIDFGFVDQIHEEDEELTYHKMGKERIVLVAKNDYKINEVITVDQLLKVELIMCTLQQKTCEHLVEAMKPMKKDLEDLNVIFSADSLSAVKSSILNGYGMAFVPYESIKHELYEKHIKLVEVEGLDLDYDIYMVSKKPKELGATAKLSREYLMEVGRKSFC